MAIQTLSGELYNKEEVESIKTELDEKISEIVITGGGVSPAIFEETVTRLEAADSSINTAILSLQEADTSINERITALEAGGGSGGSTTDLTVVNERLTALEAEDDATIARVEALENKDLTLTDNITALQEADTSINARVTALEAGGGSGGLATDELLVLTLDVDVENITDTTTWLLNETINFDALYQSYLAKTNKPVVINIGMVADTGSTQYSFRDVITSAEDTQIRITGDAMSAAIAPNLRFTIDLVLIKDETTGNCTINTAESKFLMQKDTGGGSGEAVPEKIFEFTGEYLLDATADEPTFTVNIDAIDSDKFKEAVDDSYKFQLHLRAPQTRMPIVITSYIYAIQGTNYVFGFNLDSLGVVDSFYGRVQISVIQNEETGNYELGTYGIDKGDDYSLNLVTLDKRVTALEESSDDIIDTIPVVTNGKDVVLRKVTQNRSITDLPLFTDHDENPVYKIDDLFFTYDTKDLANKFKSWLTDNGITPTKGSTYTDLDQIKVYSQAAAGYIYLSTKFHFDNTDYLAYIFEYQGTDYPVVICKYSYDTSEIDPASFTGLNVFSLSKIIPELAGCYMQNDVLDLLHNWFNLYKPIGLQDAPGLFNKQEALLNQDNIVATSLDPARKGAFDLGNFISFATGPLQKLLFTVDSEGTMLRAYANNESNRSSSLNNNFFSKNLLAPTNTFAVLNDMSTLPTPPTGALGVWTVVPDAPGQPETNNAGGTLIIVHITDTLYSQTVSYIGTRIALFITQGAIYYALGYGGKFYPTASWTNPFGGAFRWYKLAATLL